MASIKYIFIKKIMGMYTASLQEIKDEIKTRNYQYIGAEEFYSIHSNALVGNSRRVGSWKSELYFFNKGNMVKATVKPCHDQHGQPTGKQKREARCPITSNLGYGFKQDFLRAHPDRAPSFPIS